MNITTPLILSLLLAVSAGSVSAYHTNQLDYGIPADRKGTVWLGPEMLDPAEHGIGKAISDVALGTIGGEAAGLYRGAGRVGTLIVIRDPQCPVSRRYGPRLSKLAKAFSEAGFGFVFLYPNESLTEQELSADARALRVPGVYAARGSFALSQALGVESTGDVFVLDAAHQLRYRGAVDDQYGLGYTKDVPTRHYLRNALEALSQGQPVPVPATSAPGCYIDADPEKDRLFIPVKPGGLLS